MWLIGVATFWLFSNWLLPMICLVKRVGPEYRAVVNKRSLLTFHIAWCYLFCWLVVQIQYHLPFAINSWTEVSFVILYTHMVFFKHWVETDGRLQTYYLGCMSVARQMLSKISISFMIFELLWPAYKYHSPSYTFGTSTFIQDLLALKTRS